VHRPAPLVGEHGASVLAEAGYSEAEITALRESGVLGAGRGPQPREEP
jgi:crotonobetainyl-CoA:carnitine CoA-transferase CaiB-like acyl-CoA transferase